MRLLMLAVALAVAGGQAPSRFVGTWTAQFKGVVFPHQHPFA